MKSLIKKTKFCSVLVGLGSAKVFCLFPLVYYQHQEALWSHWFFTTGSQ